MTNYRTSFQVLHKEVIQWFPGHMGRGLKQMQQKLKTIDCVIEVHDSRIPFSGRNPNFKHTVSGIKPHILVLNKKDLSERRLFPKIADKIRAEEGIDHVLFTNCKDQKCDGIKKLLPLAIDMIANSDRYNRSDEKDQSLMIIGVPNVGKSSMLNVLRNRHLKQKNAAAVGAIAGITRSVLNKIKISEDPLIYMLDTPGILTPNIGDTETGMRLALMSCLQDHLVGEDIIADYLLYWLNKNEQFGYVKLMGLEQPTDMISEVLLAGSKKLNRVVKFRNYDGTMVLRPDIIAAAQFMIKAFRMGHLGKFNIDRDKL